MLTLSTNSLTTGKAPEGEDMFEPSPMNPAFGDSFAAFGIFLAFALSLAWALYDETKRNK